MVKRVSVVIVNWNGRHYLETCLPALYAQTFADFGVVLVDNGSTDGSTEWIEAHFPCVQLIKNTHNVGFAEANNQAIRATETEFVATLNNDTRVEPGWLEALLEAVSGESDVGMVASKMLFTSYPDVINAAGIALDPVGIAWDRLGGSRDDPTETQPYEVFGPCAGAALYRRAMLDQIGMFDERFFAYLEDVDLAWRGRLAGWRCLYAPSARVYHAHSATGVEGSPFKSRLLGRNKVWLIAKNYGPLGRLLVHLPLILLYDGAAILFALIARGDVYSLLGRLEGGWDLPRVCRQRRAIQALARVGWESHWYQYLAPLAWPWRVSKRYEHLADVVQDQEYMLSRRINQGDVIE